MTPDQAGGDGQYAMAVKGSLIPEGADKAAFLIESPAHKASTPRRLDAIIPNLPKLEKSELQAKPSSNDGFKTWQCLLCAFTYDEAAGLPDEGIAPGTRWEDVPESWTCPDCSAGKSDFDMVEV